MANKYVTVAGAGAKTGVSWANAFGLAEWLIDLPLAAAGDNYWVEEGTYTSTSALTTSNDGAANNPIRITGVLSGTTNEPPTESDYATSTNRPLWTNTAGITYDNYWRIENMRIVLTTTSSLKLGNGAVIINSYIENASTGYSLNFDGHTPFVFNSEIVGGAGILLNSDADYSYFLNNYIHDANKGLYLLSVTNTFESNIIADCGVGIDIKNSYFNIIKNNTLYNGTSGIDGEASYANTIINNTISSFTDGIKCTSASNQRMVDYNNYYNNTTDVINITKGPNALAVDPQFTDASNGDFSVPSDSNLAGQGFGVQLGIS